MSTIKLKRGYDLKLKGGIRGQEIAGEQKACNTFAIVPDDFGGVIPRLDKKAGDAVAAGEPLYHDKNHEQVKVVSPVAGVVKDVRRGERRKIEAIIIEADATDRHITHDLQQSALDILTQSGLWVMMHSRPYDVVPDPTIRPRDIFVTAFDSAPLAPQLMLIVGEKSKYLEKGVEVLSKLTDGNVYVGVNDDSVHIAGAQVNRFIGPHPAGNVGVQIANVKPVNKGEVVWTLDVVTLARIGELFTTGQVSHDTVVAITGESVAHPGYVKATMGCTMRSLLPDGIDTVNTRIISGNALTGIKVDAEGFLRAPYRHITIIPEVAHADEFMGWASLSPKRFSLYRTFTSWLCKPKDGISFDARVKGGERAIVRLDEYDDMLPMDIYAEFLIKAIIAFDIDKMEQLGIYEVAPEDFALAEFACTSKLELQHIVRDGLDRMRAEMA